MGALLGLQFGAVDELILIALRFHVHVTPTAHNNNYRPLGIGFGSGIRGSSPIKSFLGSSRCGRG